MAQLAADVFTGGKYVDQFCENYIGNSHYDWEVARIALAGEKLIHHWGVWGYQMRVEAALLKVAGMGAVVTHPEYRKQGVMHEAAQASFDAMTQSGYDLSILRGRHYVKLGYARAWNYVTYWLKLEELPTTALIKPFQPLRPEQIAEMDALYNQTPRERDQAPRLPAGVVFAGFGEPTLNDAGQIAFMARLSGPGVTPATNSVLYAADRAGRLYPLVRTGDLFDVGAGPARIVDDVLQSTTRLIANRQSYAEPWKRDKLESIALMLKACLAAEGKVGLMMNVQRSRLNEILSALPAQQKPTVAPLSDADWVDVNTIIEESVVRALIPQLKAAGAKGIVEYAINQAAVCPGLLVARRASESVLET